MFYLTGLTTNICSIAQTLLLTVVFGFPTLISIIYDSKEMCSLSTKVTRPFYDMVKISAIII